MLANQIPQDSVLDVLIVDDNRDSADILACLLPFLVDCTPHIADSGIQALAMGDLLCPQVVILDISMPGMSGCEAARLMRERPWGRKARIITLSGWSEADARCGGTLAAIDFHLTKPVSMDGLSKALTISPPCVP